MTVAKLSALFMPVSRCIQGISFVIALIVGEQLIANGCHGQLMSHTFYLTMLTWPMIAMGEFINVAQQNRFDGRVQESGTGMKKSKIAKCDIVRNVGGVVLIILFHLAW